jgi:hypothetical protein
MRIGAAIVRGRVRRVAATKGTILRSSDGDTWTAEPSGTTAALHGVWAVGGDAWAVGDQGALLHFSP